MIARRKLAIRFFLVGTVVLAAAAVTANWLPRWPQLVGTPPGTLFPPVFALSTGCLLFVSGMLSRVEYHVLREWQTKFRRCLCLGLAAGTGFLTLQGYALSAFLMQRSGIEAGRGAAEFVAVSVALHGMHVLIAWLFLLYVFLQALEHRYDHEYCWGVTFCAWFWHGLGIVWLAVLCVMAIANQGVIDDGMTTEFDFTR